MLAEATLSRNRQRTAFAYAGLGMLALRVGDLPTAGTQFEHAAALYDSLGMEEGAMISRQNRAEVMAASGDLAGARAGFTGALGEADRFDFFEDGIMMRQQLARVAMRQGDWAEAEKQLDAADRKARGRGLADLANNLVYDRGVLALGLGRPAEAERLFAGFLARWIRRTGWCGTPRGFAWPRPRRAGGTSRARSGRSRRRVGSWRSGGSPSATTSFGATPSRPRCSASTIRRRRPRGCWPPSRLGGRSEAAFALAERRRARHLTDRLNQADALRESGDTLTARLARARPLTAPDIARALPDGETAMLEYVAGSEGAPTTLFIVTRSGVVSRTLPAWTPWRPRSAASWRCSRAAAIRTR